MPSPLVQTVSNNSAGVNSLTIAVTLTPTVGNSIIVMHGANNASAVSISDTKNTYVNAATRSNNASGNIWVADNVLGGSTTITVTIGTTGAHSLIVREYVGLTSTGSADVSAVSANGLTTTETATSGTTNQANELVIGMAENNSGLTITLTSGYGNLLQVNATSVMSVSVGDKVVATTGTQAATGTQSSSFIWGLVATFKLASPVVVQSVAFKSVNTTPATGAFASNITAGNAILLLGGNDDNPSVFGAFSDTRGNTYNSLFAAVQPNGGNAFGAWLATNSTGGANTISAVTDTFDNFSFIAYEISGLANSSTLDVANSTFPAYNTVSTTTTTNSITTANANDILIAAYFDNSFTPPTAVTAGTGYANAQFIANVFTTLVAQTKTVSATGTYSANVTETYAAGNANTSGIMIALKAAGGATVTALGATLLMMGI